MVPWNKPAKICTGALYQFSTVIKTSVTDDVIVWPLPNKIIGCATGPPKAPLATGLYLAKTCEAFPRSKQFTCFCAPLRTLIRLFCCLFQNLMLEYLHFLQLPDSCLMMSECSNSWCAVSVFESSLCWLYLSINTYSCNTLWITIFVIKCYSITLVKWTTSLTQNKYYYYYIGWMLSVLPNIMSSVVC